MSEKKNAINFKSRIVKKVVSVAAAVTMGLSAVTTTGFVPWANPMEVLAIDAGTKVYDSGVATVTLGTGGVPTVTNWRSVLTDTEQASVKIGALNATLQATAGTSGVTNVVKVDTTDPDAVAGSYCYVAEGTVTGSGSTKQIVWSIRLWREGQNGASEGYQPTTRATAQTEWENGVTGDPATPDTNYEAAKPVWGDMWDEEGSSSGGGPLHITTSPYRAEDDGSGMYGVPVGMIAAYSTDYVNTLGLASGPQYLTQGIDANRLRCFMHDYNGTYGNKAWTYAELLNELNGSKAPTDYLYKYLQSGTTYVTDYSYYAPADYANYLWGTQMYPAWVTKLNTLIQSGSGAVYNTMMDANALTGFRLNGVFAESNAERDGVPTKAWNDGTDTDEHSSAYEFDGLTSMTDLDLTGAAFGEQRFGPMSLTTTFVAQQPGVTYTETDTFTGRDPYQVDHTGVAKTSFLNVGVSEGFGKRSNITYSTGAGTGVGQVNNARAIFDYDFFFNFSFTNDVSRYTAGLTTPNIDDSTATIVSTTAVDNADADKNVAAEANAQVKDTVSLSGLTAGTAYTLSTTLKKADSTDVVITAGGTTNFVATGATMNVDTTVTFDASAIAVGTNLIVCQQLYEGTTLKATHDLLTDAAQTVTIVEGTPVPTPTVNSTTAVDSTDLDKNVEAKAGASIKDTVNLVNLTPATTYSLVTTLKTDAGTAVPITSGGTTNFVATAATMNVDTNITFDASAYAAGTKIVVCQELFEGTVSKSVHALLTDAAQTVTLIEPAPVLIPTVVSTVAVDAEDGDKEVGIKAGASIKDTVNLSGLTVGNTYKLTTTLKKIDGSSVPVTSGGTTNFVATGATMAVDVTITFNSNTITDGTKVVVCQELFEGTVSKDTHNSLADAAQTVTVKAPALVPTIVSTTATDSTDDDKNVETIANASIKDVVKLTNLTVSSNYKLVTTLKKSDGTLIPLLTGAETLFSAIAADMDVNVTLTFDGSLIPAGTKVVVCQELFVGAESKSVHNNLLNLDQTVTMIAPATSEITRTVAVNADDVLKKTVSASKTAKIKDTVYFTLKTNGRYTLTTSVVDATNAANVLAVAPDVAITIPAGITASTYSGTIDSTITVDTSAYAGKKVVVFEVIRDETGAVACDHRDLTDLEQTITVLDDAKSITATFAKSTKDKTSTVAASKNAAITDTIYYKGFTAGTTYYVGTKLIDKISGAVIYVTAPGFYKSFVASALGYVDIDITADITGYEGRKIVVYEYIYATNTAGEEPLAKHEDINDFNQTLTVKDATVDNAILFTVASGNANSNGNTQQPAWNSTNYGGYGYNGYGYNTNYSHYVNASESAVITDRVYYEGLEDGQSYTVTPSLYDVYSGMMIPVQVMPMTFVANSRLGYVDVRIPFNSTSYAGKTIVVFEAITHYDADQKKQVEVGYHRDLWDYDQMVYVTSDTSTTSTASITSTVATGSDGSKTLEYSANAVIKDRVYYTGLSTLTTYTMQTSVVNVATGAVVATKSTTFTSNGTGYIDITIPLNSIPYEKQALVVYESVYSGLTELCYHKDRYDVNQTVTVAAAPSTTPTTDPVIIPDPVIDIPTGVSNKSEAIDSINKSHTMSFSTNANILNIVRYAGLVNGKTYTVVSTAYDKSTGIQAFDPVSKTFIADSSNVVENLIPCNTTLYPGKSFVVFASILENGVEISSYKNINDPDATVTVATVDTILTSENRTSKTVSAGSYVQLADTVRYTGLTPGRTYKITGYILNKEENAGKVCNSCDLIINGNEGSLVTNGVKIIDTKVMEFTPTTASGSIDVIFGVNTTPYTGQHLVAFEIIQDKEYSTIVGEHKDVNDANQTVIVKTSTNVYTGDDDVSMPFAIGSIGCITTAIAIGAYVFIRKRKESRG